MNLLLASKLAVGGFLSTGTITFGTFVAKPNLFGYYGSVYIFAKTQEVASTDESKEEFKNVEKPTESNDGFKCKFSKINEEFGCKVFVPKFDKHKNSSIETLKQNSSNKVDVKSENKIVKIKLSQKVKDWENKVLGNDIVIVSGPKDSIDTNKKFILKPLFTVSSARKTIGKTKFFVAQAGSDLVLPKSTDSTQKPKDTYAGTGWNEGETAEIKIFNFSDQENTPKPKSFHKELSFKKTIPKDIKKHKHYLIQCEERDLAIWHLQTSNFLHYKHQGDEQKQVTFRNIVPVIYDEDSAQVFTPISSY